MTFINFIVRWFGPDLQCHPIDCGAPEDILNGKRAGDCTTYRCQVMYFSNMKYNIHKYISFSRST